MAGFQYNTFLVSKDAGVSWSTTVDGNTVTMDNAFSISVVPEPGQMALLAMAHGGGGQGIWRRSMRRGP